MSTLCDRTYNDVIIDLPNREVQWCCKTHLQDHEKNMVKFTKDNLDYDFLFNHPLLKQRQEALENDIQHPHCKECWISEQKTDGKHSFRKMNRPKNNKRKFSFIEVSVTHTCNMMCKYCGPEYSTKWQSLVGKKLPDTDQELLEKVCGLINEYYDRELSDVPKIIFNMMGGEPIMSKNTDYFIETVIDHVSKNKHFPEQEIHIMFTTNYNFDKTLLERYMEYTRQYDNIGFIFHISNESVSARAEFIRTNLDYEKWINNVEYTFECSQNYNNVKIAFGCAHNSFTFPYFKEFLVELNRVAKKANFKKHVVFIENVIKYPHFLDVSLLDKNFVLPINDMIEYYENMDLIVLNHDAYLNFLKSLRDEVENKNDLERDMVIKTYSDNTKLFDYSNALIAAPHIDNILGL